MKLRIPGMNAHENICFAATDFYSRHNMCAASQARPRHAVFQFSITQGFPGYIAAQKYLIHSHTNSAKLEKYYTPNTFSFY